MGLNAANPMKKIYVNDMETQAEAVHAPESCIFDAGLGIQLRSSRPPRSLRGGALVPFAFLTRTSNYFHTVKLHPDGCGADFAPREGHDQLAYCPMFHRDREAQNVRDARFDTAIACKLLRSPYLISITARVFRVATPTAGQARTWSGQDGSLNHLTSRRVSPEHDENRLIRTCSRETATKSPRKDARRSDTMPSNILPPPLKRLDKNGGETPYRQHSGSLEDICETSKLQKVQQTIYVVWCVGYGLLLRL